MTVSLSEILRPNSVRAGVRCASKKRCLESIADLIAEVSGRDAGDLLDNLNARERLGSTGLGQGVAIPHCRLGAGTTSAALLTLDSPIEFGAIDDGPVDLLFALVVPEDACEEHLQLLAKLAELFSRADFCERLRGAPDDSALFSVIQEAWQA
jgi:PTS system nitrogen regulatory IIA component